MKPGVVVFCAGLRRCHGQPLLAIEPVDLLVAHREPLSAREDVQPSVAEMTLLGRQGAERLAAPGKSTDREQWRSTERCMSQPAGGELGHFGAGPPAAAWHLAKDKPQLGSKLGFRLCWYVGWAALRDEDGPRPLYATLRHVDRPVGHLGGRRSRLELVRLEPLRGPGQVLHH